MSSDQALYVTLAIIAGLVALLASYVLELRDRVRRLEYLVSKTAWHVDELREELRARAARKV